MEKIVEIPDEEWNEEGKFWLFTWVEWMMSLPKNQLMVYGRVVDPIYPSTNQVEKHSSSDDSLHI